MERDLTKGSVTENLIYMAMPTMLGFIAQTLYDIVDMIWIGRISAEAVAGVTIFAAIFWMIEVLNEIIGVSSISLISQSYGKKELEKTKKAIEQTITFKAIVAIIAAIILYFSMNPLLNFFTDDLLVVKSGLSYGYIRIFFLPIFFSSFSLNTALRCIGDSKKPMYIMAISAFLNIILDPIFMFDKVPFIGIPGFGLGVFGAAVATVISITVACALGFWIFLSGRTNIKISIKGLFKLDKELDKKLITIGLPSGFENLLRNLSGFIVIKMIALYGTNAVAAMGIGNRLMGLIFMPLLGFSMGGSTIVGQNLGAQDVERADKTAKIAAKICVGIVSICSIFALAFPAQIMKIFVDDRNVIDIGIPMIRIIMPGMIALGVLFGLGTVFSGSGYNLPFLVSSLISRWIVQVPLLLLVVYALKLPIEMIWISFVISEIAEMVIVVIFYVKGKWKNVRV
ncbi:MATE family efflux transporter [Wukongibacter baidiensis]|uniref:MATE family efflux transporter n=1 Tax=Wukongibacter baidiensis TaxID=1723361 RepID=UPI003D7F291B